MEGIIKIKDLRVHCIVGTQPYERTDEQELSIDIEVKADFQESVQTDSIVDTIDYVQLAKVCGDLAKSRHYHLLETFAYEALNALLDSFPIKWAKVCVKKKRAVALATCIVIELEKEQS